jgi:hypothetical protein
MKRECPPHRPARGEDIEVPSRHTRAARRLQAGRAVAFDATRHVPARRRADPGCVGAK